MNMKLAVTLLSNLMVASEDLCKLVSLRYGETYDFHPCKGHTRWKI